MKTAIRYFCILILVFSLVRTLTAQTNTTEHPWFFIQITDPQFGMFENNERFEQETILYEKAVVSINQLNPDFVVITGDFVHNPNSSSQIQEFKKITAKINSNIPVYYIPGNHDVGKHPDKESLEKYTRTYGEDRFSFVHKGSSFIGINTSLIKAGLKRPEQLQYKWLHKKLKKSKGAGQIVIFSHYPFFNKTLDEPEAYSNLGIEFRNKYLSLFESYDVQAVFSGHYHNNALTSYGDIQLVTTSALGKPLGKAPSGMRIIKIFSDRIQHVYYGLDDLPDKIKFD